jgi:hypothetical protein
LTIESSALDRFVILADESADWTIAGLRQLERLVLAINEFGDGAAADSQIDVLVFWKPDIPSKARWLPRHPKIKRVRLTESLKSVRPSARVISTRLFLGRHGLGEFLQAAPIVKLEEPIMEPSTLWTELSERFEASCRVGLSLPTHCQYLERAADIPACERRFLRRAGKSQDGLVSRFLNRPISRSITQLLLKYPIDPTTWAMWIFVLPFVAFFFLARGDYFGVVIGAALFQLYSILDGCDGEIARAKYLETERGARIDNFLDMIGSVLFVIGLGFGLFRSRSSAYMLEGILCAVVILVNEWLLRAPKIEAGPGSSALAKTLYLRHRELIRHSGLLLLGEKFLWWLIQFTKRDVAVLVFLLLALANLPQWILHLWITVASVSLILAAVAARSADADRRDFASPGSRP